MNGAREGQGIISPRALARDLLIFKSAMTPHCRAATLSIAAVTATQGAGFMPCYFEKL